MSLPSFMDVRSRIENVTDLAFKRLFQLVYLFGLRIGEACGYVYPSDIGNAQPTGMLLWASKATWQIPDEDDDETITLLRRIMARNYGRTFTDEEVMAINEPAFVLSIITEKREGFNRQVAIPLNPEYEDWAKDVVEYIMERQVKGPLPHLRKLSKELNSSNGKPLGIIEVVKTEEARKIIEKHEPIFPFYRQEVYPVAVETFKGFTYPIVKYSRQKKDTNGNFVTTVNNHGKEVNVYEPIPGHQKRFSNHALRHERSTELKTRYRIKGDMLNSFMGWARGRGSEASAMQDRYVLEPWREAGYFPKLLRRRV